MHPNDLFLQRYAEQLQEARVRIVRGDDPSIFRVGDQLIHLAGGRRHHASLHDDTYDRAKFACHTVVSAGLLLQSFTGALIGHADRELLRDNANALAETLEDELTDDERELVSAAKRAIEAVIEHDTVKADTLGMLARDTADAMQCAIERATRAELERIHEAVGEFTAHYGEDRWERLHVVICANHQARYKHATKQYFLRLLGETHGLGAQGERQVIYAENAKTEDEAIALLATHRVDTRLGKSFEASPLGLQQDVLGEAADAIVTELLG